MAARPRATRPGPGAPAIVAESTEYSAGGLPKDPRAATSPEEWISVAGAQRPRLQCPHLRSLQAKLAKEAQAANLSECAHDNEVGVTCRLTIAY